MGEMKKESGMAAISNQDSQQDCDIVNGNKEQNQV